MKQSISSLNDSQLELAPHPSLLIESLRDLGYSIKTALADIVDNSITAGARRIEIFADTNVDSPAIGVMDDGYGMNWQQLREAMRLGTLSPLDERGDSDLGRFGIGLKTASFSQCRRLTVVTRHRGKISRARWDLDSVAACNRWLVEIPTHKENIRWSQRLNGDGTLVVWEKLDRIVNTAARSDLVLQLDGAADHLGFVFHRFLSGSQGLSLSINGRPIKPFDPFHPNHSATQHHTQEVMSLGGRTIQLSPVTLPHHDRVSVADWKRYAGPEGYINNQGFYLYRNQRLIVHGTWFRLAIKDERTKLARIAIDIPNTMDAEWKIDVKKASAQPPPAVRRRLARIIDQMVEGSRRTYQDRGTRKASSNRSQVWIRRQNRGRISYSIDTNHPAIQALRDSIPPTLRPQYERVLRLVAAALPVESLHHDVSTYPKAVCGTRLTLRDLNRIASIICCELRGGGMSRQEIRDWMQSAEPFSVQWEQTAPIITRLLGDHNV